VVEVPNGVALDYQVLNVVINGKKYELMSSSVKNVLLALGDYKAKLVQDEHKTAYDSLRLLNWERFLNGVLGGRLLPRHEDQRCHNEHRPDYDDHPKDTPLVSRWRYPSRQSY